MTENVTTYSNGPADEHEAPEAPHYGTEVHENREAPAAPQRAASQLDEIYAEFAEIDPGENLHKFVVLDRPNFTVEFNCTMSSDEMKRLQKGASTATNRAGRRGRGAQSEDTDQFKFAASVLREKSTALYFKGKPVKYDNVELSLNEPKFLDWVQNLPAGQKAEVHTLNDAVEFLLGAGYMVALADDVLAEAGVGATAVRADPK